MSYVVANRVFVKQQYTEEFEPSDFEASITTSTHKGDRYPEIRHTGGSRYPLNSVYRAFRRLLNNGQGLLRATLLHFYQSLPHEHRECFA
jgi:hypothetical protein